MEYEDWGELVTARFPPRDEAVAQREWESLRRRLAVGDSVTGVVVARAHSGAWVDIGAGFPALLAITAMAGLTPEQYQAGDWCPVGSEVAAEVSMFRDQSRQIYLRQIEAGE